MRERTIETNCRCKHWLTLLVDFFSFFEQCDVSIVDKLREVVPKKFCDCRRTTPVGKSFRAQKISTVCMERNRYSLITGQTCREKYYMRKFGFDGGQCAIGCLYHGSAESISIKLLHDWALMIN